MTPRPLMSKPGMDLPTPPSNKTRNDACNPIEGLENSVQDFINKAPMISKPEYPWDDPYLQRNPNIRRSRTYQLPDILLRKLDYISDKTGESRLGFVQRTLEAAVEGKLHELGIK